MYYRSLILISLAATLMLVVPSCSLDNERSLRQKGEVVVAKIEAYKDRARKLPDSLSDLGMPETEEGPIYYRKINDHRFEIWYGRELGESATYDSETKRWSP